MAVIRKGFFCAKIFNVISKLSAKSAVMCADPPRFVLEGRSQGIKVYQGIYNLSSLVGVEEWRYIFDKQIISNICFQKKLFRNYMSRYAVEIPLTDWKIFFPIA